MDPIPLSIKELSEDDRFWTNRLVVTYFQGPLVVSRGVLHDTAILPGLVAESHGKRLGLLQFRQEEEELEVVILVALVPRRGIGRMLLEAVKDVAYRSGCNRLWLITTNDNLEAQEFYHAVGWQQVTIHQGAISQSRQLKPEIPQIGLHDIPIEDEIEFEFRWG